MIRITGVKFCDFQRWFINRYGTKKDRERKAKQKQRGITIQRSTIKKPQHNKHNKHDRHRSAKAK